MGIKIGLGLNWTDFDYDQMLRIIKTGEELGYDHIWVANEKFSHDMYITATEVAEHTTKPTIGTFVADPYSLHPALTAMAIATLDEVSHGRAILCMGSGGTGFPEMGIERRKPAQAIKEAILIIRALLNGQVVDFNGEVIQFKHGHLNFHARGSLPIIVASRGDLVLEVAGEVADGVMIATFAEPEGIQNALFRVERGATRAGRSLEQLCLMSRVDVCISNNPKAAYAAIKPHIATLLWTSYPDRKFVHHVGLEVPKELENIISTRDYYALASHAYLVPDEFVDKFSWSGTVEEVAQKLISITSLGFESFNIMPVASEGGNVLDIIFDFATKVRPIIETTLIRS